MDDLRNLAVAALALPDFRQTAKTWNGWPEGSSGLDFDPVALRLYARGNLYGDVSVRRLEDDLEVARLPGSGRERTILFGTDGQTLLLIETKSGVIERWPIGTQRLDKVATISNASDVTRWQQSRDGRRLLAVHVSKELTHAEVIDLPSGRRCLDHSTVPDPQPWVSRCCASLSPDGRWLAMAVGAYATRDRNDLWLFDLDTGQVAGKLNHPRNVFAPVWHPDSRTLAVGNWDTNEVYVWDALSRTKLHTLRDQKGGEPFLAISASGQLLTSMSGWAGGQVFWHPHTGKPLLRTALSQWLSGIVEDGRLYGYTVDKDQITLRIAEPSPVLRTLVVDPAGPSASNGHDVAIDPAGRLLAVGDSDGVSLFDLVTGIEAHRFGSRSYGITRFARFDPSTGDLLTYSRGGLLRWPIRSFGGGREAIAIGMANVLGPGSKGSDAAFDVSRDGRIIAVANYGEATVFRKEAQGMRTLRLAPLTDTRRVRVSPDGRWAMTIQHTAPEGLIWDTQTGRRMRSLPAGVFTPDSRWVLAGRRFWKVEDGEPGPSLPGEGPGPLTFSPDGSIFAGQVNDETIHLVDSKTGKTLVQLTMPEQCRSWCASFSPDGTKLVHQSMDHHHVYAWDLRALRSQLAELGLDWGAPAYPPSAEKGRRLPPIVTVHRVNFTEPATRLGTWALAEAAFAWRLNPFDADAHCRLGATACAQGRWRDGFVHLSIAQPFRPDDFELRRLRAVAAYDRGRWAEALAEASWILRAQPGHLHGLVIRAKSLQRLARHTEAVADFASLLSFYPDNAGFHEWRATSYDALKDRARADADRKRALEIAPNNPRLMNTRAWYLLTGPESQRDPVLALKLAKKAMERMPGSAFYLNTLGIAQYRNGLYQAAILTLQKSLTLGKGQTDGFDLFFLAMCHAKLGDTTQARDCLARAATWMEQRTSPFNEEKDLKAFRAEAEGVLQSIPRK